MRSATKEAFAHTLLILGRVALAEHRYQDAANYCKESLGICQELGEKEGVALALESLAGVWAALRQAETAAKLLGSAQTERNNTDFTKDLTKFYRLQP